MNIPEALKIGTDRLKNKDFCERPLLDSILLFSAASSISKESLLAARESDPAPPEIIDVFLKMITQRENGESVAAILGEKEFYGRPFKISSDVLSPRPDTEFAVEAALDLIKRHSYKNIFDLCTGSGCIAITIFMEEIEKNTGFRVSASDISPHSRKFFGLNNAALAQNGVKFTLSDLFNEINEKFDLIVTNPPYLTALEYKEKQNEGWKEPQLALDGGDDGFDFYRKIISEAPKYLSRNGAIVIEAASSQMLGLQSLLEKNQFSEITTIPDLSGELRIITGRLLLN